MPAVILTLLLADLLSIGFPFITYYLYREWHKYTGTSADAYADRCLYGAIALLLLIVLGRLLAKTLLSKRRQGDEEPHLFKATARDVIKRPDGSLINIEYYGRDDAQPIIFVHGLNANSKNWYYQCQYFQKNYRLILMDLPGMGKSTRPANNDYSLTNLATHLQAVIEHSGAKNPILWGHSMGGMTILTFLAKNRDVNKPTVKGVILEHTTYTNPVRTTTFSDFMTAIQKPVLTPICWMIVALSPLIWISRWMSYLNGNSHIMARLLTFAGTQTPRHLDYATLLSTMTRPAVTARGCLAMFRYDVTEELSSITTPVLIVAANKDRLTRPEASVYMQTRLSNAELVTVAPGSHQALLERHAEANEAAERFIEKLSK